jgi:predicted Ser/Thr protein kinase
MKLEIKKVIGEGLCGSVFKAKWRGSEVAVKKNGGKFKF